MSRLLLLAALGLPLLGLGALWAQSERTWQQGTEWEVPIEGYDPRDILRGHYVEFTYDWPGFDQGDGPPPVRLCIEGAPPRIERATLPRTDAACAHPLGLDTGDVYGTGGLFRGRLYVGQDRARQLEEQLRNRDQRGIVTIRQREDGSFTPLAIRFRPLTPAERAARAEQNERAEESPPPPAIMSE